MEPNDGTENKTEAELGGALLVGVPPVAWLQAGAMGGSLPCVVEWLPVAPHDLLLVIPPCLSVMCAAVLCRLVLCSIKLDLLAVTVMMACFTQAVTADATTSGSAHVCSLV